MPNATENAVYRFAVFGDLGSKNPVSLARLQDETQMGHFDMILHNGDFAYNMRDHDGEYGDQFMRQVNQSKFRLIDKDRTNRRVRPLHDHGRQSRIGRRFQPVP